MNKKNYTTTSQPPGHYFIVISKLSIYIYIDLDKQLHINNCTSISLPSFKAAGGLTANIDLSLFQAKIYINPVNKLTRVPNAFPNLTSI